jgi:low affinity Fe/Cu permease
MHPLFATFARWTERQVGRSATFILAISVVVVWAASGPFFGWSDTWQLVINTGTTIVTFLMVFVIQNTQSRDTRAIHLKLDELIRVTQAARNTLISLEEKPEADLEEIAEAFADIAATTVVEADLSSGLERGLEGATLGTEASRAPPKTAD